MLGCAVGTNDDEGSALLLGWEDWFWLGCIDGAEPDKSPADGFSDELGETVCPVDGKTPKTVGNMDGVELGSTELSSDGVGSKLGSEAILLGCEVTRLLVGLSPLLGPSVSPWLGRKLVLGVFSLGVWLCRMLLLGRIDGILLGT
eukprot:CAMPEP_0116860894 /NCGR_PEP_ID=MMETSP0418-20121206/22691_1 /TAXON_ID=1158023 /ORGANISM="Astrosyne radiata, Strain 13vi08-1A" /LENGTH=144 /DNA_ID=CAMNT_0004495397 /DNA_START=2323 /DNA_END=2757 /DNA_ORIENTATION=+